MNKFVELINTFDVSTMIVLGIFIWALIRNLKKELIEKIDKLDLDIRRQGERTDKLYEMFLQQMTKLSEQNIRVARIEGTLYGKEIYEKVKE